MIQFRFLRLRHWYDLPLWLVYRGFWVMIGLCLVLFILFATGVFAHEKVGLDRFFGRIIVGYVDFYFGVLGFGFVATAFSGFRARRQGDKSACAGGLVCVTVMGGVFLVGSGWLLWRLITS